MSEEYLKVLETCKHALCTVGVAGKDSIDRMLGCIIELQDKAMTVEKLSLIIDTLNSVSVCGVKSLGTMLDVLILLEQVRDGTFDVSQLQEIKEGE